MSGAGVVLIGEATLGELNRVVRWPAAARTDEHGHRHSRHSLWVAEANSRSMAQNTSRWSGVCSTTLRSLFSVAILQLVNPPASRGGPFAHALPRITDPWTFPAVGPDTSATLAHLHSGTR
jgi:hypothetical protein